METLYRVPTRKVVTQTVYVKATNEEEAVEKAQRGQWSIEEPAELDEMCEVGPAEVAE